MTDYYRQRMKVPGYTVTERCTRLNLGKFKYDNLWVFLRDSELPESLRRPREVPGVPQTVLLYVLGGGREMLPLEDGIQNFLFGLSSGLISTQFGPAFDAFNLVGSKFKEGCWNAITHEGELGRYAKLPMYLGMGGATFRAIEQFEAQDIYGVPDGTPMLKIETINPKKLPKVSEMMDAYGAWVYGKIPKMVLTTVNGSSTNRFRSGLDVFSALFSDYGLAVEVERCRKISTPECPYR